MKNILPIVLIAFFACVTLYGQGTAPVDSDSDGKLEIASKQHLLYLSANGSANWSGSYEQTANIAFTAGDFESGGDFYNGGEGFSPIGTGFTKFTGSYDGQDYTIDSLYINRPSADRSALFGYAEGAIIENLGLTNVNITGKGYVGGLVGNTLNNCTITNCYTTGQIRGLDDIVGGLVGIHQQNSTLTRCYSTVDVIGDSSYVGGLVGWNTGSSSANGSVVSNSYSRGSVYGNRDTGGLVGLSFNSEVRNCYSTGSVNGVDNVGGLVGQNAANAIVDKSYSTGDVSGTGSYIGGLIGLRHPTTSTATNSFWNTESSGQSSSAAGTGKTTVEMKTLETFTDESMVGLTTAWDFETNPCDDVVDNNYWDMDYSETINHGYPFLSWENGDAISLPVELASFTPVTPDSGTVVTALQPVLRWAVPSTLQIVEYRVYLGTDSTFTGVSYLSVDTTFYRPGTPLAENEQYHWKIEAVDTGGSVYTTKQWAFWTNAQNETPEAFALVAPADSMTIASTTPTFRWQSTSDPDPMDTATYTIEFGTGLDALTAVDVGEDTSFTVIDPLTDNATYYWKVTARDRAGAVTENTGGYHRLTVNTGNDSPTPFTLVAPDSGSMVTTLQPTLRWSSSSDPDPTADTSQLQFSNQDADGIVEQENSARKIAGYNVVLDTDQDFSNLTPIPVDTTFYTPSIPLAENQRYYWQVEAQDDSGAVIISETWSFWTNAQNDVPEPFHLLAPGDSASITTLQPVIQWETSVDKDVYDSLTYKILLGDDVQALDTMQVITGNTWQPASPLMDNSIYYLTVIATDLAGAQRANSGGVRVFAVNTENESPAPATLIAPDSVIALRTNPVLYWNTPVDPDPLDSLHYEVHWGLCGEDGVDSVLTDTNTVEIPRSLHENQHYRWYVISMDRDYSLSHSAESEFWVDAVPEPPGAFQLVGPADDTTGISTSPTLAWNTSEDADPFDMVTYRIQIGQDSTFATQVMSFANIADTAFHVSGLDSNVTYYWRVCGIDKDSLVTWASDSAVWSFHVGIRVGVESGKNLPAEFSLAQNYPNPFNPITTLKYGLPQDADVRLVIYDLAGRKVSTLVRKNQVAGWYQVHWNGTNDLGHVVSTGVYFYRFEAGNFVDVKRMVFMK